MTPAQKKNVERFKKAAAEAKKLRAKNPKLSQAQAVKQAFAILYKGGKIAAVKTAKKATVTVKKKKPIADNSHRDNRSHNVNIRVMSGIGNVLDDAKDRRNKLIDRISKLNADIFYLMDDPAIKTATQKGRRSAVISIYKKSIANYKKELKLLDKIISDAMSK